MNSGNAESAKQDFEKFVAMQPGNEEARLKLAEADLSSQDYSGAVRETEKLKSSPFRESGVIIAARAHLESGDFESAMNKLSELKNSGDIRFLVDYWTGVALYRSGSTVRAKPFFESSLKAVPAGHWVRTAAQEWLDQIGKDLFPVRGQLSLGYFADSNIGQSGTQSLSQYGVIVAPNTSADPNSSTKDAGWWVAAELGVLPYVSEDVSVNVLLDFSSPYYFHNRPYNLQSYSVDLSVTATGNPQLVPSLDIRYLDTRYNTAYYQDYLIATPQLAWQPAPLWFLRAGFSFTQYLKYKHDSIFAPSASVRRIITPWLSLTGGLLYSMASGTAATFYNSSYTYVTNGVEFSNYKTLSEYVTASAYLPADFSFNATVGHFGTSYDHEAVPTAAISGTVDDRSDSLWQITLDLSRPIIAQHWIVDASWTFSNNSSRGFQGVPSGSTMTNYNYDRSYFLLNNTISF